MRVCPYCQNDAPVVYRGMVAYCTACGAVRPAVLPTKSINLAGQPSKVGGIVAKVFGWLVLFFGYSAYSLRKGYQPKAPITKLTPARAAPLARNAPIA